MGRMFKFLIYLIFAASVGLIGYAYLGPWFGADFSAQQGEIRIPVILDAN